MSTVTDYLGRVYDVAAYVGQQSSGDTLLTQELVQPGDQGQICTGAVKLAQWFIKELQTETGSMIYQPTRGCDFMALARNGYLQIPFDVMVAFSGAVVDIRNTLTANARPGQPDDELFSDAEIVALNIGAGRLSMTIAVTSLAGSRREVILPISVTPGGQP